MRAVHLDDFRALLAQLFHGGVVVLHHAVLPAIALELLNEAYLDAAQITLRAFAGGLHHGGNRPVHRRGVEGIVAGNNLVQERGIQDGTATGTRLVQRGRGCNQAVARYRAVGGLYAHGIGQRRRLANGSAGIGTNT